MDLALHVGAKLGGDWSAASATGLLSDTVIDCLTSGAKWGSLEPLARARLLISPLFLRRKELEELRGPLELLAAAGAADRDEWVRVTATAVSPYDGRLHTAAMVADSPLLAKTVEQLRRLLDAADPAIYRPREEAYLNRRVLQQLRGRRPPAVPPHQHFRPREAAEAPSAKASPPAGAGGAGAWAAGVAAARAGAGVARGMAPAARPSARAGGGPTLPRPASRPQMQPPQEVDIFFSSSRPAHGRPLTGAGAGGVAAGHGGPRGLTKAKRTATLDTTTVAQLNEKARAEREARLKAEQEEREAAERAKAEAKAAEKAAREVDRERAKEAARLAAEKARDEYRERKNAEKEAAKAAKDAEKQAAAATKDAERKAALQAKAEAREADKQAKAAARQADKAARDKHRIEAAAGKRRRASDGGGEAEPPPQRSRLESLLAASASVGGSAAPAPLGVPAAPQDAAAALSQAALLAAADSLGMGSMQDVEAMAAQLAAAFGGTVLAAAQQQQQQQQQGPPGLG